MEKRILENIESMVLREFEEKNQFDYSLLGGDLGKVIFLLLSSKFNLRKYEAAISYLDKVLHSIKKRPLLSTYCNGISGVCVGLLSLSNVGLIEDVKDSLEVYDDILSNYLNWYLTRDLDFLHGGIGIGMYFVKMANFDEKAYNKVISILDFLELHAERNDSGAFYFYYPDKNGIPKENISISHGICSTIMFVARAYKVMKRSVDQEKCKRLIDGMCKYLLSKIVDPKKMDVTLLIYIVITKAVWDGVMGISERA